MNGLAGVGVCVADGRCFLLFIVVFGFRELALQIEEETQKFASFCQCRTVAVVGGRSAENQAFLLRQGLAEHHRLSTPSFINTIIYQQDHLSTGSFIDRRCSLFLSLIEFFSLVSCLAGGVWPSLTSYCLLLLPIVSLCADVAAVLCICLYGLLRARVDDCMHALNPVHPFHACMCLMHACVSLLHACMHACMHVLIVWYALLSVT